jgi:2-dehydro-3-deoxygluconokinase
MEKIFDLVAIGECLVELTQTQGADFRLSYAGDVLNTLFYASRLGLNCGLISQIGDDLFTAGLIDLLEQESIDRTYAPIASDRPNGLYAINTDDDGEPQYNFWRSESAARETLRRIPFKDLLSAARSAKHLHISSIALAVMHDRQKLLDLARRVMRGTIISIDANVRKSLWKDLGELRILLLKFGSAADILFVTDSDDEALWGKRTPEAAISAYCAMGYPTVVLRTGAHGSIIADNEGMIAVAALKSTVMDPTGAGDAFNAGFLRAYLERFSLIECAMQGNAVASCVLGVRGGLNLAFDRSMANQAIATLLGQLSTRP